MPIWKGPSNKNWTDNFCFSCVTTLLKSPFQFSQEQLSTCLSWFIILTTSYGLINRCKQGNILVNLRVWQSVVGGIMNLCNASWIIRHEIIGKVCWHVVLDLPPYKLDESYQFLQFLSFPMPNTQRLICQRKTSPDTRWRESSIVYARAGSQRGSYLTSNVIDVYTTLYIVYATSSCQRGMYYSRHGISAMYPGLKSEVCGVMQYPSRPGGFFAILHDIYIIHNFAILVWSSNLKEFGILSLVNRSVHKFPHKNFRIKYKSKNFDIFWAKWDMLRRNGTSYSKYVHIIKNWDIFFVNLPSCNHFMRSLKFRPSFTLNDLFMVGLVVW
jgi:hypothetical protein